MSLTMQELVEQYTDLLEDFARAPTEALRERAHQIGSEAIAHGLGVLDVAAAHREALLKILRRRRTLQESERTSKLVSELLLESLVPFEMTHRGYEETIRKFVTANEALRKSEAKNLGLLNAIPDTIFRISKDGTYLDYKAGENVGLAALSGEPIGKQAFEILPTELATLVMDNVERALQSGLIQTFEYQLVLGGDEHDYEVRLAVAGRDEVLGIVRDITERKRTEAERERLIRDVADKEATLQAEQKAARERERLLKQVERLAAVAQRRAAELQGILDNMVDAVFVCDVQGRITLVNEAGLRLFSTSSIEDLKRPLADFPNLFKLRQKDKRATTPEELPLVRALKGEIIVQEDEISYNQQSQRDVYIRTSAAPIRGEDGTIIGAVGVSRDVTELTEFDRLKDQFITVAAHELKTPVTIMKGSASLLLRTDGDLRPAQQKLLEAMNRNADRINRIVEDLLDISWLQQGQLELSLDRVDLSELIEDEIGRMALTTTKHQIRLGDAAPLVIVGDRDRLSQVLVNLIDNAIRYSPNGGEIELTLRVSANEALVSVTDHGVGIPLDKQRRIFERFYRAHTGTPFDYGGMGVGLYISKEIVSRHGGQMCFESEEGQGASFHFSLPYKRLKRDRWPQVGPGNERHRPGSGRSRR